MFKAGGLLIKEKVWNIYNLCLEKQTTETKPKLYYYAKKDITKLDNYYKIAL